MRFFIESLSSSTRAKSIGIAQKGLGGEGNEGGDEGEGGGDGGSIGEGGGGGSDPQLTATCATAASP
eukprot:scaffold68363_cov74-Phaeocystis_antarctica.AAC.1